MSRALIVVGLCLGCALAACAGDPGDAMPAASSRTALGPLPGVEAYPAELRDRLGTALQAKGEGYEPRTHHFRDDGSPKYTNRLILESSPYLNQHAHNPVNWYPWGDEAFEAARKLGRPVLLSVGYSTCHWCHVMERESFEDEEIARFMNEHYVSIKVDREERPDIDAIYMSAVQAMTGRGGWPMTVWLTPDREPFYGGTYFPARDGDRGTRSGFLTLLGKLGEAYDAEPERVAATTRQLAERIRRSMAPVAADGVAIPGVAALDAAAGYYRTNFDPVWGGTKRAPKFPSNFPVRLLLRQYRRTGDEKFLEMASLTLRRMAEGGIHDHVGGGFHRYSTDAQWLVPHFEKMLYDNALLTVAFLEGYQASGDEAFAEVARRTLDYVAREMTSPEGAFYSATDADSPTPDGHDEEGWFFTWTPAEIEAVIGKERAGAFGAYYGVTDAGNFEGRNILNVRRAAADVAGELDMKAAELSELLRQSRVALYDARLSRPAPIRDDKILTSWNGLMIGAFAVGGLVLDDPALTARAARAADFVLARMREEGRLRRSYKDGRARFNAYLDDYAFLGEGLLHLYEATSDPRWLREAVALQKTLDEHYLDADNGGYFMTSDDHEALLAREKPSYDGAEPSGNSVALMNLVRLHELTSDDRYRASAERLLQAFSAQLTRAPAALSEMLLALDFWLDESKEIVIVTKKGRESAGPFLEELRTSFVPNRVLVVARQGNDLDAQAELVPLLNGKTAMKGKATAYVCERGVCKLPTTDPAVFAEQITAAAKRAGP